MRLHRHFPPRRSDPIMDELVSILAKGGSHEFRPLFDIVLSNLRAREAVKTSEDLLRLRAYENLQKLLTKGAVTKSGKAYTARPERLALIVQQGAVRKSTAPSAKAKT